jgi:hypothetical protein
MPIAKECQSLGLPKASRARDLLGTLVGAFKKNSPKKRGERKRETVIFFDWDDTLLCSSFLSSNGFKLDGVIANPDLLQQLDDLSTVMIESLKVARTYGQVSTLSTLATLSLSVITLLSSVHFICCRLASFAVVKRHLRCSHTTLTPHSRFT